MSLWTTPQTPHLPVQAQHFVSPDLLKSNPTTALLPILNLVEGWKLVTKEQMAVSPLSGAMSNMVFRCEVKGKGLSPVLVRVHGTHNTLVDRASELRTFMAVAAAGLGPRMLVTFANGWAEQFLTHHSTLTADLMRQPRMAVEVARSMAGFHFCLAAQGDVYEGCAPQAGLWGRLRLWLQLVEELWSNAELQELGLHTLAEEISALERGWHALHPGCWLAPCHNDLQYGNIMVRWLPQEGAKQGPAANPTTRPAQHTRGCQEADVCHVDDQRVEHVDGPEGAARLDVRIIDYEYACINPCAFDIGNHWCEWTANYHGPEPHFLDFTRFPSAQEQEQFSRAYLQELLDRAGALARPPGGTQQPAAQRSSAQQQAQFSRPYLHDLLDRAGALAHPPGGTQPSAAQPSGAQQQQHILPHTPPPCTPHATVAALHQVLQHDVSAEEGRACLLASRTSSGKVHSTGDAAAGCAVPAAASGAAASHLDLPHPSHLTPGQLHPSDAAGNAPQVAALPITAPGAAASPRELPHTIHPTPDPPHLSDAAGYAPKVADTLSRERSPWQPSAVQECLLVSAGAATGDACEQLRPLGQPIVSLCHWLHELLETAATQDPGAALSGCTANGMASSEARSGIGRTDSSTADSAAAAPTYLNGTPELLHAPPAGGLAAGAAGSAHERRAQSPHGEALDAAVVGLCVAARDVLPLVDLHWGLWGLVQAASSSLDFEFLAYGRQRIGRYQASKQRLLRIGGTQLGGSASDG